MKDDLLERLAREAGRHEVAAEHRVPPGEHGSFIASTDWVRRFAALVAEECAKVCEAASDSYAVQWHENADRMAQAESEAAQSCAESIRARFKAAT